ncbi:hypothetical protein [Streptomyces sp. NPDC001070]
MSSQSWCQYVASSSYSSSSSSRASSSRVDGEDAALALKERR